jgi:hypothetical protein
VAGFRTVAGTTLRDSLTSGFAVRSAASTARLAQYDVAGANSFFPSIESLAAARLPRDAGSVTLLVGSTLDVAGNIRTAAAASGRGAVIALAANRLRVSGTPGDAVTGWVTLLDSQLRALERPGADEHDIVRIDINRPVDQLLAAALAALQAAGATA